MECRIFMLRRLKYSRKFPRFRLRLFITLLFSHVVSFHIHFLLHYFCRFVAVIWKLCLLSREDLEAQLKLNDSFMLVCLLFEMMNLGGTVSIDCRRCLFDGCATNYNTLETIETTAHGAYEIDLFGGVHICDRYIAMATAHCRFDGRHFMWNRFNYNNGPVPQHYNKIWAQSKGKHLLNRVQFT